MQVRFAHAAAELAALREPLEALNLASRRRCAFTAPGLLEAFLLTDPRFAPGGGAEPWIALASEGARLAGYLPLRRVVERIAGLPAPRLEPLITVETDRPHPVARPEDLPRVTSALWAALLALPRSAWSLLELPMQDEQAELQAPPLPPGLFARHLPSRAVSVVPLAGGFEGWWAGLDKRQRHNARRQYRQLQALGPVSALATEESPAQEVFDAYLELEARSWKAGDPGSAALHRHPERVAYYRRLLAGGGALRLRLELLLVHDRPVAGKVVARYGDRLYHLHTAFDDACAAASPGSTLTVLAMRWAARRGFRAVNLLPDFEYHKRRWGAEVTPTRRLQVIRTLSPHGLKALAGQLRRRLVSRVPPPPATRNPSRVEASLPPGPPPALPNPGPLDPRLAAAAARPGAERLDPPALRAALACLAGEA